MDVSAFDQAQASLRDMARMIAEYHKQLVDNGMTRSEATAVVIGWQAATIARPQTPDGGK